MDNTKPPKPHRQSLHNPDILTIQHPTNNTDPIPHNNPTHKILTKNKQLLPHIDPLH